ncbi:primary-amine oxidase [Blastomyces dermatitidis ER-3]|uniref:Amine oxidase n=1 Tax=Ajellomyces dermatitidis (strain ER-3 / ATCC MYA-2586) TaxID=559297 RepID=A0ABP2ERK9_AJEDR|nr:primary-amine oxidase [Blastomyces dermatitidis ER-3]EEQ84631.1 primary-amine oxidase [Blastomyces dermatitidis ER-3]
MALDRLKQLGHQVTSSSPPPHPFDPLSTLEIDAAVAIICTEHDGSLRFNAVTLWEPRKVEMMAWLANPKTAPRPHRAADVVAIAPSGKETLQWKHVEGVQPLITMEDLNAVEPLARKDPKIIEQCGIIGIPPEDMHKVYCDPWTIGYDERFGSDVCLQQALMYYRPNVDDCQYAYPLDFCPIYSPETKEFIHIDVSRVLRPISKAPPNNYDVQSIERQGGYRDAVKPIHLTQPEGVSFKVDGRVIDWQNWNLHVGFNYREGIVLNNITFNDKGTIRPVFYRLLLAGMVVPYGNPEHPHHRKHAFDLGEYGGGYMTNSLSLGCDCKGVIHHMGADFVNAADSSTTIKNAICIHEEDAGILFKHTDFRDDSVIVTRGLKLIISHIFTATNYEYCVYWIFHQDGTIQLDIKLTGILNTYAMNPGVNAHNHQHLFCLRINANVDGPNNTIFQVDATRGPGEAMADYDGASSRTWDIANTNKLNPHSKKPVGLKLVSRGVPALLPREGGLVWNRAGFARHAVHVTKYADDQLYPASRHVPQTSDSPSLSPGLPTWISEASSAPSFSNTSIENTDVVLWHTFGITHFPSPEDFPIMPAEPMSLSLRPRNFFARNPALDVKPSWARSPSQVAVGIEGAFCGSGMDPGRKGDGVSRVV